jgi:ribonuclease P protein subunit RPR2
MNKKKAIAASKKASKKQIAQERIERLFEMAEKEYAVNPERAHRYVELARNLAMHFRIKIPREYAGRYCKHCYAYLVPGVNSRVRTRDSTLTITCLACGHVYRMPFARETKAKRKKTIDSDA